MTEESNNLDEIKKKVAGRTGEGFDDGDGDDMLPPEPGSSGLPLPFIDQCYNDNVMGDATLFAEICKGRFLYNGNSGNWHRWGKHYWEEDVSHSVMAAIGYDVAEKYEDRARELAEDVKKLEEEKKNSDVIARAEKRRENVSKRAFQLKGDRAKKVLTWVPSIAPHMVVDGDEFDKAHHLIACNNGVVNLETGECHPGDPEDKITLSLPHEWPGIDAEAKSFIYALRCSLEPPYHYKGDSEAFTEVRFRYVKRFIGAAIHGTQRERAFMVLYGEHGWNGKGTLMETLLHVLGDYAAAIEPEILLDSRGSKDAGRPTPHILSMKGKRILVASETDDGNRFSASAVKRFSGSDTLVGRNPHDIRNTYFKPTHTLFLMTNNLPYTDANDRAFWERLHLLNFHWSYVDKPKEKYEKKRDPDLEKNLRKEAPQIFAWIAQGYLEYIAEGGLNPPKDMIDERETYRFRDDTIAQFVDAWCEDDPDQTAETPFCLIKEKFDPWYMENMSKKPMSAKMLGTLLSKKYNKVKDKDNKPAYVGIQLKRFQDGS